MLCVKLGLSWSLTLTQSYFCWPITARFVIDISRLCLQIIPPVSVPQDMDVINKLILLGATFLIDFVYFEAKCWVTHAQSNVVWRMRKTGHEQGGHVWHPHWTLKLFIAGCFERFIFSTKKACMKIQEKILPYSAWKKQ